MRRVKSITRAVKAQQGSMTVWSGVIRRLISALGQGTKDRLIVVSFLFVAAVVTVGWMIGLAWGASTLAEWLFSESTEIHRLHRGYSRSLN